MQRRGGRNEGDGDSGMYMRQIVFRFRSILQPFLFLVSSKLHVLVPQPNKRGGSSSSLSICKGTWAVIRCMGQA